MKWLSGALLNKNSMEVPVIATNRCIMREISKENYIDFFYILKDRDIEYNLQEFCCLFNSLADVKEMMGIFLELWEERISCLWGIYINTELIGFIGLLDIPTYATIFYGLRNKFSSKGIMTECVEALCRFMVSNKLAPHIFSHILRENIASIRVLEKCGFKRFDFCDHKIILKKSLI